MVTFPAAGLPAGYTEWAPPAALQPAVACLWAQLAPEGEADREVVVLPDACSDLIWEQGRGVFVAGPDTRPAPAWVRGGTLMIGVRFRSWAGGPVLGLPLSELRNQRVDLADLRRVAAGRVPGTLDPELAITAMIDLAGRLVTESSADAAVRQAARQLADPRIQVEDVAAETGVSPRQLLRRFDISVGYGPKTLQRILRFQRFVTAADRTGGPADLGAIAADLGYSDQAHLTRECVRLAGVTPGALLSIRQPSAPATVLALY